MIICQNFTNRKRESNIVSKNERDWKRVMHVQRKRVCVWGRERESNLEKRERVK